MIICAEVLRLRTQTHGYRVPTASMFFVTVVSDEPCVHGELHRANFVCKCIQAPEGGCVRLLPREPRR